MARLKEVEEGNDNWVQELTSGMMLTAEYSTNVTTGQPWTFTLSIDNRGTHEPHLHVMWVEILGGPTEEGWRCAMVNPAAQKTQAQARTYLFYLPKKRIVRNAVTTAQMQCVFSRPGAYTLLVASELQESGIAFFSKQLTVNVR